MTTVREGELGTSPWQLVDRERIREFARLTGDEQWIHVDEERAAAGPYRGIVAHGMLTLSLVPGMVLGLLPEHEVVINRGFRRVDFRSPVPAGARVRGAVTVDGVRARPRGLWEVSAGVTVQIDGSAEAALRAELILLCR